MKNRKRHYGEEFKQYAVNFHYSSGKSLKAASGELKISRSSLNNWVQSLMMGL
jgi:transposase